MQPTLYPKTENFDIKQDTIRDDPIYQTTDQRQLDIDEYIDSTQIVPYNAQQ